MLQKRLDYSFYGYQVPTKRRATRLAKVNKFTSHLGLINRIIYLVTGLKPILVLFFKYFLEEGYISKKVGRQSDVCI